MRVPEGVRAVRGLYALLPLTDPPKSPPGTSAAAAAAALTSSGGRAAIYRPAEGAKSKDGRPLTLVAVLSTNGGDGGGGGEGAAALVAGELSTGLAVDRVVTDSMRAASDAACRGGRRDLVRGAMAHAWAGYRQFAWGFDELKPLSRTGQNNWGACVGEREHVFVCIGCVR